ncbi:hypothetical protein [Corynebacterium sp.]|uniref:hypothetical protein n=1 Tax=Corynebacterium sp. TaxID=1720 RepID=UPI0025BD9405|nr:hypothetical protein [Corynebacterium sp.]
MNSTGGTDRIFWSTGQLLDTRTRRQIQREVRDGRLYRLARGIYSSEPPDDMLTLRGLHELRGLVYTGRTAMELYTGEPVTWPVQARHPGPGRTTDCATIRSGVPGGLREGRGFLLVSPLQAAMDADLPDADLRTFLAEAYRGKGGGEVLEEDLSLSSGHRERARALVRDTPVGAVSLLERRAFEIVREALADLPVTVLLNQMVGNYCYDLVIPEAKVAVEIDSFMYHAVDGHGTTLRSFIRERWKDNEATHLGWALQHYTNQCIRLAAGEVADDIRRAVLPRIRGRAVAHRESLPEAVWTWHPALMSSGAATCTEPSTEWSGGALPMA